MTSRRGAAARIAAVALALATVALFLVSRGRWCDAIIDGGREFLLARGLSRGKLLYRDIHYWSGPITIYFQAAFFRAFGSSFTALALAGSGIWLLLLAAFRVAVRRVSGSREAALWTAAAIPAVLFMPNGGGVLVGMSYRGAAAFGLASLATLAARRRPSGLRLLAAGLLTGLSGLCRTEWGFAVLAGGIACLLAQRPDRGFLRRVVVFFVSAAVLFGAAVGAFAAAAGARAVITDGHLLLTGISEPTRHFAREFSGIGDWRNGLKEMAYSTLMWVGLVMAIGLWTGRRDRQVTLRRLGLFAALLVFLGLLAASGAEPIGVTFSAAPVFCLAAALLGARLAESRRAGALAGFGVAGLLLFHRRPFHVGDSWYAGSPLLFACVAAAGLARVACLMQRNDRRRNAFARGLRAALAILVVVAFGARFALYAGDGRVAVAGTNGMITARPEVAAGLDRLAAEIRAHTRPEQGLAVFPEGEIVNAISGRDNPMRFELYLPDTVTLDREAEILADLKRARPAAVVVIPRLSPEYGPSLFGVDYGVTLKQWIDGHYREARDPAGRRRPFEGVGRLFFLDEP